MSIVVLSPRAGPLGSTALPWGLYRLHVAQHQACALHCRPPGKAQAGALASLGDPDLPMPEKISFSDAPIIQADPIMQTGRSHAPSEVSSSPNGTLYDKLGGPDALEAAVDLFYEKVLADERLKHFFEGTNMMRLVIKQVCLRQSMHACAPSLLCLFVH